MIPLLTEIYYEENEPIVHQYHYRLVQQTIAMFLLTLYMFFSVLLYFTEFNIENPIIQFASIGFGFTLYLTYIYCIIRRYQLYKFNLIHDRFTIKSTFQDNIDVKKNEYCIICLHDFVSGKATKLLCKCNSYYHSECINKWLSINNTCPLCRLERPINIKYDISNNIII